MAAQQEKLTVAEFNQYMAAEFAKHEAAGSPALTPANPSISPSFRIVYEATEESKAMWNTVEFTYNGVSGPISLTFDDEVLSGQVLPTDKAIEDYKMMGTYELTENPRASANYKTVSASIVKYKGLTKGAKPTQSTRTSDLFVATEYINSLYQAIMAMRVDVGSELLRYINSTKGITATAFKAYYEEQYKVKPEFGIAIVNAYEPRAGYMLKEDSDAIRKYFTIAPNMKMVSHIQTVANKGKSNEIPLINPISRIMVRFTPIKDAAGKDTEIMLRHPNNKFYDMRKLQQTTNPETAILMVTMGDGTVQEFGTHNCHRILKTGTKIDGEIFVRSVSYTNLGTSIGVEFSTCSVNVPTVNVSTQQKFSFLKKKAMAKPELAAEEAPAPAPAQAPASEHVVAIDAGEHAGLYDES